MMNRKQTAAIVIGMLLLLAILVWPGSLAVGKVVSRVPTGSGTELVAAELNYTPASRALLALVTLGTVVAVIRLRSRAAS
jgi:hypothetical protein